MVKSFWVSRKMTENSEKSHLEKILMNTYRHPKKLRGKLSPLAHSPNAWTMHLWEFLNWSLKHPDRKYQALIGILHFKGIVRKLRQFQTGQWRFTEYKCSERLEKYGSFNGWKRRKRSLRFLFDSPSRRTGEMSSISYCSLFPFLLAVWWTGILLFTQIQKVQGCPGPQTRVLHCGAPSPTLWSLLRCGLRSPHSLKTCKSHLILRAWATMPYLVPGN